MKKQYKKRKLTEDDKKTVAQLIYEDNPMTRGLAKALRITREDITTWVKSRH